MGFLSFFKSSGKGRAPGWTALSEAQRGTVVRNVMKAMAGPRYRVVSGFDQTQREQGVPETCGEDGILDSYARGRLLDMTRNAARNSSTFATILKQFDFNVCGTKAGKAVVSFEDQALAGDIRDGFAAWTRSADFFDGLSFNQLLKIILKNALIGGDCVILFDDGLVEDSARLLVYESDEIGNVPDDVLKRKYGDDAVQSLGKVYSSNSRWIGTTVSRACRGRPVFDPDKCYFLTRDPDASPLDSLWLQPSNVWRVAQGRGVSQAASSIGTITDLEDLCGFELQAAKKNAQTFAQILRTSTTVPDTLRPGAFDKLADGDLDKLTDEEIEKLAEAEAQAGEKTTTLARAASCGIVYEQLPDDYKMELLDTKHPNDRTQDFIKWLAGRSSAAFGLSEAFATLMPTAADFKAQQLMTQPAFQEAQKFLEQICDWTLYRYVKWLGKKKLLDLSRLPPNWMRRVSWSWPAIDEMDEVAHQNAVSMKLRNLTGTLREELGNDWREKLRQSKEELEWCRENGIPHPALGMISGGERSEAGILDGARNA